MPEQVQPGAPGHPSAAELDGLRWRAANGGTGGPEITLWRDKVLMRNGRDRQGPVLVYTPAEWDAFLLGIRAGEFERRELTGKRSGQAG